MGEAFIDTRYGLDQRAVQALMKSGILPGSLEASSEGPLRWKFTFTFLGDRELAKWHVSNFIADEYSGTNVLFYASAANPRRCYCYFTVRMRGAIDASEVEDNGRRSDRERKAGNRTTQP